jgi:hypothetical protein
MDNSHHFGYKQKFLQKKTSITQVVKICQRKIDWNWGLENAINLHNKSQKICIKKNLA